jgi:hypothetical protein
MLFPMVGPWSGTRPWPTLIITSDIMPWLSMMSIVAMCIIIVLWIPLLWTWTFKLVCNNFYQSRTFATSANSCNISICDVKYVGDCISGLAFARGTLFDPAFGGLSGRYPTGQGVTPFEVRWSPYESTCYLSWCNSGWFCHIRLWHQLVGSVDESRRFYINSYV